jgi:hypothetical protein
MSNNHAKRYLITATLVAAATAGALLDSSPSSGSTPDPAGPASTSTSRPWTPNDCIRLNQGDYNACNVGNSGRGDRPYQAPSQPHAPTARYRARIR